MAAGKAVVVGTGVKAPGGLTVDELWTSLCAARPNATVFTDERLPADAVALVCRVAGFDASAYLSPVELRRLDRSHALAIGAAQDATAAIGTELGLDLPPPERRALVCGVGLGATATYEYQHEQLLTGGFRALSPLTIPLVMPSTVAAHLSLRFDIRGPCLTVSSACASGAAAIAEATELLRHRRADVVLAGGVDSMVTYNAMCSFMRLDVMSRQIAEPDLASRPFDAARDGFVMGEGAGFVWLMREEDVAGPGLGTVLGHASNADAYHLVAPSPDGAAAARCIRLALADAEVAPGDVMHVNAHGTSTVLNDRAEAAALRSVFGPDIPPVTAVKGSTGHLIGGSGAVEAIVAWRSVRECCIPPVTGLRDLEPGLDMDVVAGGPRPIGSGPAVSTSFGFGGSNTVLVLGD